MTEPQLLIFENLERLTCAAVERFAGLAQEAIAARGRFKVALSGGNTPQGMYRRLAQSPYRNELPWSQTHFFWGDERDVPPDHPESNYHQAFVTLLNHTAVPAENIHRVKGELEPRVAAKDYADQLRQFAEDGYTWPRFDLVVLGLGNDGHTASLFSGPISPEASQSTVLAVTADYQGRPADRVTLTPLVLNSARQIIFLVSGASKAEAIQAVLRGKRDTARWPAQRIHPWDGTITWMIDVPAASQLK
ncbi:MAG: 6-phosphogluconolactonase [Chloroflexi bacterium]|nr:6-phosphogluconolactonase [Chloroflexota bacterium]